MKTIELLTGTKYEIEVDGNDIRLLAIGHTLVLLDADFDKENVEKFIDANLHKFERINEDEEMTLVELLEYFKNNP